MKENDQLGMKISGGDNVVEELPPNAAATHQNHRNCLHFFVFFGCTTTTFAAGCFEFLKPNKRNKRVSIVNDSLD